VCRTTRLCVVRPNFESYDQILSRTTKFCVVQPNLCCTTKIEAFECVSYNQTLCRTTELCVIQPNFELCDQICVVRPKLRPLNVCCTTKLCVVQPNFVSYNQILSCAAKFCVVRANFVSCNQILCRATKFHVLCKQTLNLHWPHRFEGDFALALLPALVRIARLVLNGPPEESSAREAGDGAVVDVLGSRLLCKQSRRGFKSRRHNVLPLLSKIGNRRKCFFLSQHW
jgi:hypothetical protein